MNRTLKLVCLCAGLLAVSVNGYSWGQKGHDVTCAIAQKHLTKKAQKQIGEILDGKSIVYWANWMDLNTSTRAPGTTRTLTRMRLTKMLN